jgi:hypothetical protein
MRYPRRVSPEGYLDRHDAAHRLGIDPDVLFDLAFDGKIQFDLGRDNGRMYFTQETLNDFQASHAPA